MIVIGASLGGMKVVRSILKQLPASFPVPIAIVLHRDREANDLLVHLIQQESSLPVTEAVDKEPICGRHVYLAPPDYHLLVDAGFFDLSTDDAVQYARPSIDVLFESAADAFGPAVIGVVLTGANHDGAQGAARIAEGGGRVIVQDPATAESPVMPLAAIEATGTEDVLPPDQIAALLLKLTATPTALKP